MTTHTLTIRDLHASVDGFEILRGVDLEIASGEVHALMGPNGSGKSTLANVLMGRDDYEVTGGSISVDGHELVGLATWERAARGLFLATQYPVGVPGVPVGELVGAAVRARDGDVAGVQARLADEARRLSIRPELLDRGVNDEFSGGEQKRMETLQLAVLAPRFAILDEIDSGLDVDALRDVSRRIEAMTVGARDGGDELGVLAITHYTRLLTELRADRVHVLLGGRIVTSGGPELADHLEEVGYEGIADELGVDALSVEKPVEDDPFAEPGF